MRKYLSCIKISFETEKQYFVNFLGGIVGEVFILFVQLFLWNNILSHNQIQNISHNDFMAYIYFSFVLRVVFSNSIPFQINSDYQKGNIAIYLVRPISYSAYLYFKDIGKVIFKFLCLLFPCIMVMYYFDMININFIDTRIFFFLLSILIGNILNFSVNYFIGIISFIAKSSIGLYMLYSSLGSFFSGTLIPLFMFPSTLRVISYILPFRYIYYSPLSVILELKDSTFYYKIILIQFLYCIVITSTILVLGKMINKRLDIQGG